MADDQKEQKFFYANSAEMALSAYDVTIRFVRNAVRTTTGQRATFDTADAAIHEADDFTVSMSPSHAKAMLPNLMELVSRYESQFGKIPLPADGQVAWDRKFAIKSK